MATALDFTVTLLIMCPPTVHLEEGGGKVRCEGGKDGGEEGEGGRKDESNERGKNGKRKNKRREGKKEREGE